MKVLKLFLALGLLLFVSCKSTPSKEYLSKDIEYNDNTNTWVLVSDKSLIRENFITTDGDMNGVPFKREAFVDSEGHAKLTILYSNGEVIQRNDYSKAPQEITITYYQNHPLNDVGRSFMETSKRTSEGFTRLYKNMNGEIESEAVYDKEGKLLKTYEWENGQRVIKMADLFPVEVLDAGYAWSASYECHPIVDFKLRNKSGKTVDQTIKIDYKFVRDDEILESNFEFISTNGGWENDYLKPTRIIGWHVNDADKTMSSSKKDFGLRVVINFEDGSLIYDGIIPFKYLKIK